MAREQRKKHTLSAGWFNLAKTNYFFIIFIVCILFVGLVTGYKLFVSKPTYVYVKVKVGQGLWWANTSKPSMWLVDAINKGDTEKNLTGHPIVEVLGKQYYPWWSNNQYDTYLKLKLEVSKNKKVGTYSFKRSIIGVGAPIDLEFSSAQVSGTIIELGEKQIEEEYVTKTVLLTKKNAFPWEFAAIQIGDKYFDGENTIFEVLEKRSTDTTNIGIDYYGNNDTSLVDPKKYIEVRAKIRVRKNKDLLIFGNEQLIIPGRSINISTNNFTFADYTVGVIE